MDIDDCNLHEEDGGCTKAPLLPTLCGTAINLMCVVSTIQGCRPLLEKEIKSPQGAIAEGSRERVWQFLSVHWMKIWPLSSSEVNTGVLEGHEDVPIPIATRCGSLCLATAPVQLLFATLGHTKGEERQRRGPLAWHQRYIWKRCVSTQTLFSWLQDGSVRCWYHEEWRLVLGRACSMLYPAARARGERPRAVRSALPVQGIRGRLCFSDFLEKTESGQLTFRHVPYLLPADFLACARPQQQPEFAHPPLPPYFHG